MNELNDTDDSTTGDSNETSYRQVLKKLSNLVDTMEFKSILEQEHIPNIEQFAPALPQHEQSICQIVPLMLKGKKTILKPRGLFFSDILSKV